MNFLTSARYFSHDARSTRAGYRKSCSVRLVAENDTPSQALATSGFEGSERRLLIRLENYWGSLRRCARGPFFGDFSAERNPVPWKNCFLAYVPDDGAEPIFDHIGGSIIALFKPDRTNLPDRDWLLDAIATRFGNIGDALATGRPVRREGRLDRQGAAAGLYRSLLLPFVDIGRQPTYLMGAVTFRLEAASTS